MKAALPRTLLALVLSACAILAWTWGNAREEQIGAAPVEHTETPAPAAELAAAALQAELVQVTTPAEVRSFVAFAGSAGHSDVPSLRRHALESENPLVVGNSIRALGRLGAVIRDEELLGMLADPRVRVRQELVRALGESGDPRAVPALADAIGEDDETLRTLAIQSLGKIGGHEARVLLENARSDPRSQGSQLVFLEQALAAYER